MSPKAATSAAKHPPPESWQAVVTKNWVVVSFWCVVLFLGLPTWLWTTSIHRARLPINEMLEWADGKACKPTFPLRIAFEAPSLADNEAQHLLQLTQHALDDLSEFPSHHLRLSRDASSLAGEEPALSVHLAPHQEASVQTQIRPHSTVLEVNYNPSQVPSSGSSSSPLANAIAAKLQELFVEEQASIAYLLNTATEPNSPLRDQAKGLSRLLTPKILPMLVKRQNRAVQYSPTYHITISLITPGEIPDAWDIEPAIQTYLTPLLASLNTSTFTVDTQVQLFSSFAHSFPEPQHDESRNVWTLSPESLTYFVNAAEWPLSPSIGPGLTLNFILYVPAAETSPLVVKDTETVSWIVPQWGGVYILNPSTVAGVQQIHPKQLGVDDIKPALLTFSRQLLAILGTPETPPESLELQIRSLTRYRAISLLLSASSTLGSMARLTSKLSQIPIPENVAQAVDKTLEDLRASCKSLREGDFNKALSTARSADSLAEQAFFEKSMVGQVYFPDEHKVAVYLPLLAPISVPLLTSGLRVIKSLRSGRAPT